MNIFYAVLFGIIEGLTEFIPVSSTAHMLILEKLLNISPQDPQMLAFLVLVQIGPLVALILYFWKDLWAYIKAFFARPFSTPENKMAWFIIIATIPALLAGFLLKDLISQLFNTPLVEAAIRFFAAAILLFLAEFFSKRSRNLEAMTWLDALIIGLFQILAVFPGSSRSGSAISGGMLRNFERPAATRFAFLMSAPIMLAAGAYETWKILKEPGLASFLPSLAVGFIIAGIVGWFSIGLLIKFVSRNSLYWFAGYCAILGLICLVLIRVLGIS